LSADEGRQVGRLTAGALEQSGIWRVHHAACVGNGIEESLFPLLESISHDSAGFVDRKRCPQKPGQCGEKPDSDSEVID
jgi:hypothetical protein